MYHDNLIQKINLDELYEKKKKHDIQTTNNYNKILTRIHSKIKTTARLQIDDHYCWFIVPEVMIGVPKYNQSLCIAYVIDKLSENGFNVRYTHPNMLFISWEHWVPNYVRDEIKKKKGIHIDGFGNIIKSKDKELNTNNSISSQFKINEKKKNSDNEDFKDTKTYKPSGNLVYNSEFIEALKNSLK